MTRLLTYVVGFYYKLLHENNIIKCAILYFTSRLIYVRSVYLCHTIQDLKNLIWNLITNSTLTIMLLLHIMN